MEERQARNALRYGLSIGLEIAVSVCPETRPFQPVQQMVPLKDLMEQDSVEKPP